MVMESNGAPTLGRSALYRSHSLSLSQLSTSEVNDGWLAMVMASNGAPTLGRSALYRSHSLSLSLSPSEVNGGWLTMVMASNGAQLWRIHFEPLSLSSA
ncbi:hypothetical protein FCV25MIE_01803 [Fagus crenata]